MEHVIVVITHHNVEEKVDFIKRHGIKFKKNTFITVPVVFFEEHRDFLMTGETSRTRLEARFSKKEVLEADYVQYGCFREFGYAKPDNDYKYERLVFDNTLCQNCKSKRNQINPFRLSKIPSLIKNKLFTPIWEYDSLFVEKEYYLKRLEPLGIGNREVIKHKKDTPFEEIVQLEIPKLKYPIDIDKYVEETCEVCGTKKFNPIYDDFIPPFKEEVSFPIVRSAESYGKGGLSYNKIYFNNELKNILLEDKQIKWDDLVPVRNSR